jgi:hypothetical protein
MIMLDANGKYPAFSYSSAPRYNDFIELKGLLKKR